MINEILSKLDKPSLFQASNVCKLWRQQALTHVVSITNEQELEMAARNGDRLSIIKSSFDNIDWDVRQENSNWFSVSILSAVLNTFANMQPVSNDRVTCREDRNNLARSIMAGRYINYGLEGAYLGGYKDLAKLMISKGATNFNNCLQIACRKGHRDLAELMINEGADMFDWGLHGACEGGHKKLAELMVTYGAEDFDSGLHCACESGHKDLVKLMIAYGAKDFNLGLHGACKGGHKELIQLMIAKGAKNYNMGLYSACFAGHKDVVNLMIDRGATACRCGKSIEEHQK